MKPSRATVGRTPGEDCNRELRKVLPGGIRQQLWERDDYGRQRLARCEGVVVVQARGWQGDLPLSWVGCDSCGWTADKPLTADVEQEPLFDLAEEAS